MIRYISKENRTLISELVRTDFKLRYQGSVLGYAWSLLRPLLLFIILYIVFVKFLKIGTNMVVIMIFMILNHVDLLATTLWLPVILLEVYVFALGLSLFLSAMFVKFRDVGYIWEVILQALFYLTPILYPLALIPNVTFQKIILLNPMAQAIQDARWSSITHETLISHTVFQGGSYMYIPFAIVIASLAGGLLYFRKESKYFAENI